MLYITYYILYNYIYLIIYIILMHKCFLMEILDTQENFQVNCDHITGNILLSWQSFFYACIE